MPATTLSLPPQLLSRASEPPNGDGWIHEIKYDGYRLLASIERGKVRLITRGGLDWTTKFPELARRLGELPVDTALIDGELVRLEPDGTTSFAGLQDAISGGNTAALTFFAFDLLYRDGWDLSGAALEDRKAALAGIIPPGSQGMLRYSDHQIDHGPTFLRQACSYGLEGIISKRRTSPYRPGRSGSWLKVKCRNREEFVVIGFTDPKRGRQGFGALLLGYYDAQGALYYAGRVGTGYSGDQFHAPRRLHPAGARRPLPARGFDPGEGRASRSRAGLAHERGDPADRVVQPTAYRQKRVADDFAFETDTVHTRQEPIVRVSGPRHLLCRRRSS